jgi:hypothetical protein
MVVEQRRRPTQITTAMQEFWVWGLSYARTRSMMLGRWQRLLYASLMPVLPGLMLFRLARVIFGRRRSRGRFLRAMPLLALFALSWAGGELLGYVQAGRVAVAVAPLPAPASS